MQVNNFKVKHFDNLQVNRMHHVNSWLHLQYNCGRSIFSDTAGEHQTVKNSIMTIV